jgi:hypothetical protein
MRRKRIIDSRRPTLLLKSIEDHFLIEGLPPEAFDQVAVDAKFSHALVPGGHHQTRLRRRRNMAILDRVISRPLLTLDYALKLASYFQPILREYEARAFAKRQIPGVSKAASVIPYRGNLSGVINESLSDHPPKVVVAKAHSIQRVD